ncbi:phenylalanine--tRNA ligase subunit beta [Solitalea canadensis]|uniref:Phenylalanine--tRNA ligase beta subunit n=1 Tax=Solitalea canadensis (strain ATCC 29591 / DSM 3403 / JCM 21819 / LMG 8368 / NBRC 15130 / NCIMB 12057 / USAM 9D) TaxID=929556 RepID=H8KP13_SOLCM|nr:phenylalanine--tRNA ligase subunit beta [Solitalea canadensis]AFD05535.1 phenylalanyl-tRNA synthetase, beta subunit [Solitalea canadensis DSM 3403]
MKISYNWLKQYIQTELAPEEISKILTNTGLEVESLERIQTIPGGLEGLVIGYVTFRDKHPNADKLSVTKVNVGGERELDIVCGAPNVAAGQKVVVATVGCIVHPVSGEPFEIKKAKIRGEVSEGMICAEDEIGLGESHAGIMVLPEDAPIGMPAKEYFKIEDDYCFEIGLTPNRVDASSHIGVARDVAAVLKGAVVIPSIDNFKVENNDLKISVEVKDSEACPRYSGVTISGVTVKDSPEWLQNKLRAIGIRPINNVVDVTNYVLHETGQPLHAFDAAEIKGNKVIVRKAVERSTFVTLDGAERKLSANDLMICNEQEEMCIAGVFGGLNAGVKETTKAIFLESAYFSSVSVRKTAKLHNLKTDSSFRFERGTDPEATVYALKRATLLIKEVAGGSVSSDVIDIYPTVIKKAEVDVTYKNVYRLIGKQIPAEEIKSILKGLGIEILSENAEGFKVSVPTNKVDVTREVDIIEEILRIYGYNNVEIPTILNSSLSFAIKPDREKLQNVVSDFFTANGFNEIMSNSLTKSAYSQLTATINPEENVVILNPLSTDLDVMRQTLLFSGLEAIAYNQNRKNADVKFYEFGKIYKTIENGYYEEPRLALFVTGRKEIEQWNASANQVDYFLLKGYVDAIIKKLKVSVASSEVINNDIFAEGLAYKKGKNVIVQFGQVSKAVLKKLDIDKPVFYADFNWEYLLKVQLNNVAEYKEVAKFPAVRRDLSMLLDSSVNFASLKEIAFQVEKNLLKEVNIFDKYEGDKLPQGKKSYALSFVIQDEEKTLTDKQIDGIMQKLIAGFEKVGAEIRK